MCPKLCNSRRWLPGLLRGGGRRSERQVGKVGKSSCFSAVPHTAPSAAACLVAWHRSRDPQHNATSVLCAWCPRQRANQRGPFSSPATLSPRSAEPTLADRQIAAVENGGTCLRLQVRFSAARGRHLHQLSEDGIKNLQIPPFFLHELRVHILTQISTCSCRVTMYVIAVKTFQ